MPTIVNKGVEAAARMIAGVSPPAAFTYIAVGTGATEESGDDTQLEAETDRVAATCSFTTPGTSVWSVLYVADSDMDIREISIQNAASGGDMFLRHVLGENKNLSEGEAVEITITNTMVRV